MGLLLNQSNKLKTLVHVHIRQGEYFKAQAK